MLTLVNESPLSEKALQFLLQLQDEGGDGEAEIQ